MPGSYRTADATVPFLKAVAVTPHDTNPVVCTRGLIATAAGDVVVELVEGGQITLALTAKVPVSIQATKVLSTGTTATGISALY